MLNKLYNALIFAVYWLINIKMCHFNSHEICWKLGQGTARQIFSGFSQGFNHFWCADHCNGFYIIFLLWNTPWYVKMSSLSKPIQSYWMYIICKRKQQILFISVLEAIRPPHALRARGHLEAPPMPRPILLLPPQTANE